MFTLLSDFSQMATDAIRLMHDHITGIWYVHSTKTYSKQNVSTSQLPNKTCQMTIKATMPNKQTHFSHKNITKRLCHELAATPKHNKRSRANPTEQKPQSRDIGQQPTEAAKGTHNVRAAENHHSRDVHFCSFPRFCLFFRFQYVCQPHACQPHPFVLD